MNMYRYSKNGLGMHKSNGSCPLFLVIVLVVGCASLPLNIAEATVTGASTITTPKPIQIAQHTNSEIQEQISRGVAAYEQGNYADAILAFDEVDRLAGGTFYSNPEVHARRAASFDSVGRKEDALREARIAYDFVREGPTVSKEIRDRFFASNSLVDLDQVYSISVNLFKKYNDSRFAAALAALMALSPTDAPGWSNRAGTLSGLGQHGQAMEASRRALNLLPNHPLGLNNHCYILAQANNAKVGLPFCVRAIGLLPNSSVVRNSYSFALAKLGRCTQAASQKAIALRLDPSSEEALKPLECTPQR
jgi:Flp pilus assembly protein TadD